MYKRSNQKYRKVDFLMVIFTVVGLAMAATLTLHVHALSSNSDPVIEVIASDMKR